MYQIEHKHELKTHLEAYSLHKKHRIRLKIDKFLAVILFINATLQGVIWWFTREISIKSLIIMGISLVIAPMIFFNILDLGRLMVRINFKGNPKYRLPQRITITEETIQFHSEEASSELKWSYFQSFLEGENLILLYVHKNQYTFLPKKAFSQAEKKGVLELLKRHISSSVL